MELSNNIVYQEPNKGIRNLDRETTTLYFDPPKDENDVNGESAEFDVRGGIAWPMTYVPAAERYEGFAVLVGVNIRTGIACVFEETPFVCIEDVVVKGQIEHEGLVDWFNKVWRLYYCDTFYYHQEPDIHRQWLRMVRDNTMIDPSPAIIEVHWQDFNSAEVPLLSRLNQHKLGYYAGEPLHQAIKAHKWCEDEKPHCAVWALMCALAGFARFPWEKPRSMDSLPDLWLRRVK